MSKIKNISPMECITLQNKNARIIDIRSPDEYAREKIPGAQCIPMDKLSKEHFSKDGIVVFHCQSGNRTRMAEKTIHDLGLKEAYILEGGISAWKKANQEIEANTKAPLPIMRQVQIIVGFMVLLGIALAYTVSPYFNILSAFFGAGLLFAGISGYCGMTNLLMLLPYNKPK